MIVGAGFRFFFFTVGRTCRIVVLHRIAIDSILTAAVTQEIITSDQKTTVDNFMNGITVVCGILEQIAG